MRGDRNEHLGGFQDPLRCGSVHSAVFGVCLCVVVEVEMKKVFQEERDDCYVACIASILEVPISEVPKANFETEGDWAEEIEKWLVTRNLVLIQVTVPENTTPKGYCILSGKMPGNDPDDGWLHAVVGKEGKEIFDPDPFNHGSPLLEKIKSIELFQVIDPGRM